MKTTPNQAKAFKKLIKNKVGALFMKMGSGKTRVAVMLGNSVPDVDLFVWIAPYRIINPIDDSISSIKDEVEKWGGLNAQTIFVGIESIQASDRIYIELRAQIEKAKKPFIFVDESIKIKNIDAKRTRRLLELSELAEYKVILNGTPFTKNLMDIYPQMQFLSPKILKMTYSQFKDTFVRYMTVTKRIGSYKEIKKEYITGYENIDFLYRVIGDFIFECDLTLNVKQIYNVVNYKISDDDRKIYNQLKEKYLDNELLQLKNNNIFLEMTQKMQHSYCITENKFKELDNLFETIPENKSIIFCKYIASKEACKKRYPNAIVLSYSMDSYGHNLPEFNHMIFFDKDWDWARRNQAKARNARITSKEDLSYYDFTGDVGLEDMIDKNIRKKTGMIEYFKNISNEELKKLL